MKFRPACAFTLPLLLAACGSDSSPGEDAGEAAGEVMEGTISDAMLPIDQTRSQPPLAEPAPGEPVEAGEGEGEASDAGEGEAQAPDDEPAPAEPARPIPPANQAPAE